MPTCLRTRLGLTAFYGKYVDQQGFPILSSARTSNAALCEARRIAGEMFAERADLIGRLNAKKIRLVVMASTEVTTDVPEHSDLTPKEYWDERARGLGATLDRPAVSAAEENLLCRPAPEERYAGENILIHELSHGIFNIAIDLSEPATSQQLDAAFAAAIAARRFANTYAATSRDEYWAEGAQDWFDTNAVAIPSDGVHNEIHTRAQLESYDPELAALQARVLTLWVSVDQLIHRLTLYHALESTGLAHDAVALSMHGQHDRVGRVLGLHDGRRSKRSSSPPRHVPAPTAPARVSQ